MLLKDVPPDSDGTLGPCVPEPDFVGIEAFKRSFGADRVEFIGEYVLVANRVKYYSYTHVIVMARKVLAAVHGLMRKLRNRK